MHGAVRWAATLSAAALFAGGCGDSVHRSGPQVGAAGSAGGPVGRAGQVGRVASSGAASGSAAMKVSGAAGSGRAGSGAAGSALTPGATLPNGPATAAAGATNSAAASAAPGSDPGLLPQTRTLPGTADPAFEVGVQALWQAIVQGVPAPAHAFFFPLSAYLQVKAIGDPADDYRNRLLNWYDLDIAAAHRLLGASAARARLVGLQVPQDEAEWIPPGVEYNKESYYRVYGSRLVFTLNGRTESIGVFSLISWRGEWYVVHLGPSTRDADEGIVYEPSL